MSIRNSITEKLVLPISDIIMGKKLSRNLDFLLKSQYWKRGELENYQNEKLRELLLHSYENVPYYNELFKKLKLSPDDIKSQQDLYKLPILTKEQVRKNVMNGKIIAKNIPRNELVWGCSSGSTGEPLQYYVTKKSHSFHYAATIRGWYWMGFRLGDKYVKISQNPRGSRIKKIQDFIIRTKYLSSQQLVDNIFENIVREINRYSPKVIRGYPDPLTFLAQYIKTNSIIMFSPSGITTTGNILTKESRNLIENVFDCRIFDAYSCEGSATVSQCGNENFYHSAMEYAISEIIDNNNEVNQGRLITTDLWNYAVPFIRYDTQDIVELEESDCACGRELLSIKKIIGRDSDILVTPKGKYLILHNFTGYFEWIDSVDQFQVRQNKVDELDIILKVNANFSSKVESEIFEYFSNYISDGVNIKINVVDNIPLTNSGKRRFLIRDKNIPLKV